MAATTSSRLLLFLLRFTSRWPAAELFSTLASLNEAWSSARLPWATLRGPFEASSRSCRMAEVQNPHPMTWEITLASPASADSPTRSLSENTAPGR